MTWMNGKQIDGKTYVEFEHVESLVKSKDDEIERLREELYEIKLAAAGGEDAPGAANMVRAKDVERWTKELWRRVRDGETEIERLREALREIAEGDRPYNDKQFHVGYWGAKARAALERKE